MNKKILLGSPSFSHGPWQGMGTRHNPGGGQLPMETSLTYRWVSIHSSHFEHIRIAWPCEVPTSPCTPTAPPTKDYWGPDHKPSPDPQSTCWLWGQEICHGMSFKQWHMPQHLFWCFLGCVLRWSSQSTLWWLGSEWQGGSCWGGDVWFFCGTGTVMEDFRRIGTVESCMHRLNMSRKHLLGGQHMILGSDLTPYLSLYSCWADVRCHLVHL